MTTDLASLGWDDTRSRQFARYRRQRCQPGRAAAVEAGVATVLTAAGPVRASVGGGLLGAAAADRTALPCAGDWLVLRQWPDRRTTIEAVLPRTTAVVLAGQGAGRSRLVAANVETVALVERVHRGLDPRRIERLLEPAVWSGAVPAIVLTGAGRFDEQFVAGLRAQITERVSGLIGGVPVYLVDTGTGAGLDALRPLVANGRTLGLIGRPGVGRSALVDALVGATVLAPNSPMVARGLDTPAAGFGVDGLGVRFGLDHAAPRRRQAPRALVPVPGGGAVLDTPELPGGWVGVVTPEGLPGSA